MKPKEGDKSICKYCHSPMIFRRGEWRRTTAVNFSEFLIHEADENLKCEPAGVAMKNSTQWEVTEKDGAGYARAIGIGGFTILHLDPGTIRNSICLPVILDILNGKTRGWNKNKFKRLCKINEPNLKKK